MSARFALAALATFALAACSPKSGEPPAQQPPADTPPASTPAPTPAPSGDVLTPEGFGKVKIGMTEQEAWTASGNGGKPVLQKGETGECHMLAFPSLPPGVLVMVEGGKVSRVSLNKAGPVTDKGLGVGATADQVKAAYGASLASEPHKYEPAPAGYLTAWTVPDKSGIRYEVGQDGKVAAVHAGGPSILYVEGCS